MTSFEFKLKTYTNQTVGYGGGRYRPGRVALRRSRAARMRAVQRPRALRWADWGASDAEIWGSACSGKRSRTLINFLLRIGSEIAVVGDKRVYLEPANSNSSPLSYPPPLVLASAGREGRSQPCPWPQPWSRQRHLHRILSSWNSRPIHVWRPCTAASELSGELLKWAERKNKATRSTSNTS
jgi:hypothetical protein